MRNLEQRVSKLEVGGQFMPDIAAMSDDELGRLIVDAGEDWGRMTTLIDRMTYEQKLRLRDALEALSERNGEVVAC